MSPLRPPRPPGPALRAWWLVLALALCLAAGAGSSRAAGQPTAPAAPTEAEQWGIFELTLAGPQDGNPFTEVQLSARFTDGSQQVEVEGFYDGDGLYRVRFMPPRPGAWRWATQSNRWPLTGQSGHFTVRPARPGNHGPVAVRHTYHFAYADGTPFKPLGTTLYDWSHRSEAIAALTLQNLASAPFNKVRMLLYPSSGGFDRHPPASLPYAGNPAQAPDFSRFNPAFWRLQERRIAQLRDLGIEADLIVHHPYDPRRLWGMDQQTRDVDDRYARYMVARLAAYRNVWWSLANEFDFVRTKTDADWDHLGQLLQQIDPYQHLRGIHNGKRLFDNGRPWVTHSSLQHGMAAAEASRAVLLREAWRKPIVFDEIKYEGRNERRWAQLTGPELVQRFWAVTIAGGYATHGEVFKDQATDTAWISDGGRLQGESPPRLAFLKQVLAQAPAEGIDPIDTFEDLKVAGQPGRYYLIYFGTEAPTTWVPKLYLTGLQEGMAFRAEVIDTWAMTTTPLAQPLVFKPLDRYSFVEASGQTVALPGQPHMAIRLTAVRAQRAGSGRADVDD